MEPLAAAVAVAAAGASAAIPAASVAAFSPVPAGRGLQAVAVVAAAGPGRTGSHREDSAPVSGATDCPAGLELSRRRPHYYFAVPPA